MVLHELDKGTVRANIKTYLKAALGSIKSSEMEIGLLAEHARILPIYVTTAVR
jgi:hypothetical protein